MQNTIIDSGPLIALFDVDDSYHNQVTSFIKSFKGNLISTWAVLTEVSHMLDFNQNVQIDFLNWISIGAIHIYNFNQSEIQHIVSLMTKYADRPMDLADSTLLFLAQKENIKNIISIDSDFDIYRTLKKQHLTNLLK